MQFQSLVYMLGTVIGKQNTAMRNAISVEERVIIKFRFLAQASNEMNINLPKVLQ